MARLERFDDMPDLEPVHPRFKVGEKGVNSNPFRPKEKNKDVVEEKDSTSVGRNNCISQSPGTHNHEGAGVPGSDRNFSDESCHGSSSMFSQSSSQKDKMVDSGRRNEREKAEVVSLNQPRRTTTSEKNEQESGVRTLLGALGRKLAAEGIELDNLTWLKFYTDAIPPPALQVAANMFLTDCRSSKLKRSDGISWVFVCAPRGDFELSSSSSEEEDDDDDEDEDDVQGDNDGEEEEEEEEEEEGSKRRKRTDVLGLKDAWEKLNESGEEINFQKIQQLALAHGTLCGKWMIFRRRGIHADLSWERIFRATIIGRLGVSAKISTWEENEETQVICVYNNNFTDKGEVRELESRLRAIGIRCSMHYKPDVFTYLGVYRGNEWGLKPVVYYSNFDLRKNSSVIVANYE